MNYDQLFAIARTIGFLEGMGTDETRGIAAMLKEAFFKPQKQEDASEIPYEQNESQE